MNSTTPMKTGVEMMSMRSRSDVSSDGLRGLVARRQVDLHGDEDADDAQDSPCDEQSESVGAVGTRRTAYWTTSMPCM